MAYFDPTIDNATRKTYTASRFNTETHEVLELIPYLELEEAIQIATKIHRVKHLALSGQYKEIGSEIMDLTTQEILNHPIMYITNEYGLYTLEHRVKVPLCDQKHKIYRIRKLAEQGYYKKKLSAKILEMSTAEIYTMDIYDSLNTHGKYKTEN